MMSAQNPEVSIIIPALNEAECIKELYERITAHLKTLGLTYEIIFADDGSTDGSRSIIHDICENDKSVGYVRHFRNHGKSLALMQGFDLARGGVAVTLDADLQDKPENIGLLLEKMNKETYDLVSARRLNRRDKLTKKVVSWVFNWFVSVIFGSRVYDVNSGMKAYSREVYKRIELRGDLHRLTPVMAASFGFRICEVPVSHSPRTKGKSKYGLLRYRGLLDIFSLSALQSTQLRTFHVFGGFGFVSFIISLLLFVIYLLGYSSGEIRRAEILLLLFAQTFLLIGVFFILIGLVAEMLMAPVQDGEWRKTLIREIRPPGD